MGAEDDSVLVLGDALLPGIKVSLEGNLANGVELLKGSLDLLSGEVGEIAVGLTSVVWARVRIRATRSSRTKARWKRRNN